MVIYCSQMLNALNVAMQTRTPIDLQYGLPNGALRKVEGVSFGEPVAVEAAVKCGYGDFERCDTGWEAAGGEKARDVGRILRMHANSREEVEEVRAGDIAAAIGLKETFTGDTLCDPENPIMLERMTFPDPVIELSVEPKTKADQEKMGIALQRLAEEDPTFRVHTDQESGQTRIAGMGDNEVKACLANTAIADAVVADYRGGEALGVAHFPFDGLKRNRIVQKNVPRRRLHALLMSNLPGLLAVAFLIGLGMGLAGPLSQNLLYDAAPPGRVGEVMGLRHRALPVEGVQFHPEALLTEHGHDMLRNFMEGRRQ